MSNRVPSDAVRRERSGLDRYRNVTAFRARRIGVDEQARALSASSSASRMLQVEGADEVEMGAFLQPGALHERCRRERRAGDEVRLPHRPFEIFCRA